MEAFHQDQIYRLKRAQKVIDIWFRQFGTLRHERPPEIIGNQHLLRAGLALRVAFLAWSIKIDVVTHSLQSRDADTKFTDCTDYLRHKEALASAISDDTKYTHGFSFAAGLASRSAKEILWRSWTSALTQINPT